MDAPFGTATNSEPALTELGKVVSVTDPGKSSSVEFGYLKAQTSRPDIQITRSIQLVKFIPFDTAGVVEKVRYPIGNDLLLRF